MLKQQDQLKLNQRNLYRLGALYVVQVNKSWQTDKLMKKKDIQRIKAVVAKMQLNLPLQILALQDSDNQTERQRQDSEQKEKFGTYLNKFQITNLKIPELKNYTVKTIFRRYFKKFTKQNKYKIKLCEWNSHAGQKFKQLSLNQVQYFEKLACKQNDYQKRRIQALVQKKELIESKLPQIQEFNPKKTEQHEWLKIQNQDQRMEDNQNKEVMRKYHLRQKKSVKKIQYSQMCDVKIQQESATFQGSKGKIKYEHQDDHGIKVRKSQIRHLSHNPFFSEIASHKNSQHKQDNFLKWQQILLKSKQAIEINKINSFKIQKRIEMMQEQQYKRDEQIKYEQQQ